MLNHLPFIAFFAVMLLGYFTISVPGDTPYAEVLSRETGQEIDAAKLVGPMLARFMATDRAFAKARRSAKAST